MSTPKHLYEEEKRILGVTRELDIAFSFITTGIGFIQRGHREEIERFRFLLLLTSGLERLMKIILVLQVQQSEDRFLSKSELKKLGHNLQGLCSSVVERCFTPRYLQSPMAVADKQFLQQDPLLQKILLLLSDFAQEDRYAYLNAVANPERILNPPSRRWEELEMEQMETTAVMDLIRAQQYDLADIQMQRNLIVCLETLLRAFTRLFRFTDLGGLAKSSSLNFWDFARIEDADLGKRQYEI